MTLDLSEWIRNNQNSKGQEFTVTYYAKVNADAVVQTNNSAHLEYGNDPENTTTTTSDEVVTPTYPLDVRKTDTKETLLAGAVFRLYKNETDANAANEKAIKVTGSDGSYVVDPTSSNMDMTTKATDDSKGYNLHLNGLAAGDYWLVETQAPDGYNKLTAPVKVTITKTGDTEWKISKDGDNEEDKIIDIKNSSGTLLPENRWNGYCNFHSDCSCDDSRYCGKLRDQQKKTCLIIYNSDIWMRGLPSGSLPIRYNSRENEIKMRRKKTEKKQFYIGDIFRVIGLIIAFSVLLYPTVSNYLYEKNGSKVISAYDETQCG